jgi:hypothetical protein
VVLFVGLLSLIELAAYIERLLARQSGRIPPLSAEYLFYLFLDSHNCDAIVGDLEERYRLIRRKFGSHRANFWYWTQAIRSVGPIAWAWAKRVMKAVSGIAALVEIYRRIRS